MELAGVHLIGVQVLCRAPTCYIAVPLEILATTRARIFRPLSSDVDDVYLGRDIRKVPLRWP